VACGLPYDECWKLSPLTRTGEAFREYSFLEEEDLQQGPRFAAASVDDEIKYADVAGYACCSTKAWRPALLPCCARMGGTRSM
jgi:hypothetical protein